MDSNNSTTSIGEGETTASIDSISVSPSPSPVITSPEKLCRVGSGSSVILDPENGIEAESRKLPSSQYKGVVPQPNGRWGAQIYEKHQRVWLGTFNEEEEAAKAYDIAAQRFRGRDAITNFKPSPDIIIVQDDIESVFLNSRSKAEIVDMLRKHTYNDELEHCKRNYTSNFDATNKNREGMFMGVTGSGPNGSTSGDRVIKARGHLFEKAVTPSDVGKLNRLVIPKQHAEKHFPLQIGSISKGLLLNFEDNEGKVWRFRYSYWNSSQSYVLTKGWSRFVKEKCLKAGDVVSFMRSTGDDKQLYIDWKPRNNVVTGSGIEKPGPVAVQPVVVQVVRLFGVDIFKMATSSSDDDEENRWRSMKSSSSSVGGNKRIRTSSDLGLNISGGVVVDDHHQYNQICNNKKQRIVVGAL